MPNSPTRELATLDHELTNARAAGDSAASETVERKIAEFLAVHPDHDTAEIAAARQHGDLIRMHPAGTPARELAELRYSFAVAYDRGDAAGVGKLGQQIASLTREHPELR